MNVERTVGILKTQEKIETTGAAKANIMRHSDMFDSQEPESNPGG